MASLFCLQRSVTSRRRRGRTRGAVKQVKLRKTRGNGLAQLRRDNERLVKLLWCFKEEKKKDAARRRLESHVPRRPSRPSGGSVR